MLVGVAAPLAVAALSAWAWIEVPGGTVPAGLGDDLQRVSKFKGLVVGPLLFTVLPVPAFWLIPLIEPRRANLLASRKAYIAVWMEELPRSWRAATATGLTPTSGSERSRAAPLRHRA